MKKLFLIILIILIALTFSDQLGLTPYKEASYEWVMDKMNSSGKINHEQALKRLRKELLTLADSWGENQKTQLDNASRSRETVLLFHQRYCRGSDFNPVLFGEPLQRSCQVIDKYHDILQKSQ